MGFTGATGKVEEAEKKYFIQANMKNTVVFKGLSTPRQITYFGDFFN